MSDLNEISKIIQLVDESEHGMIQVHCDSFEQMIKLENEFKARQFEASRNIKRSEMGEQYSVRVSW
jgi:hypothetical protein